MESKDYKARERTRKQRVTWLEAAGAGGVGGVGVGGADAVPAGVEEAGGAAARVGFLVV